MKKGFTLIELLVVIGILAILLAITLIAINPARQFGQANDTRKRSDILQILNAVHQYVAENKGTLPAVLTGATAGTSYDITGVTGATNLDLCPDLVGTTGKYMPALPTNPSLNLPNVTTCNATYTTGYTIAKDALNRITVSAGNDINDTPITITR
ncbi:MAG: type II secretion system protein [bacterium]|nr:type II secretion system protein [bacterium]